MTKTHFWHLKKYFFYERDSVLKIFLIPFYVFTKYSYALSMYMIPGVKTVSLQGSFCKKRSLYGVSDLDFLIIFKGNKFWLWVCKALHVFHSFNPIVDRVCIPKSNDEYLKFLYVSKVTLYKFLSMKNDTQIILGNRKYIDEMEKMIHDHFMPREGLPEFLEYFWASYLKKLIDIKNDDQFNLNILLKDAYFLKDILEYFKIDHEWCVDKLPTKAIITNRLLDLICSVLQSFDDLEKKEQVSVKVYSKKLKTEFNIKETDALVIKPFDGEYRDTYTIFIFTTIEDTIAAIETVRTMSVQEDHYLYFFYQNCLFLMNNTRVHKMENYLSSRTQDPFLIGVLKNNATYDQNFYEFNSEINTTRIKAFVEEELLKFWKDINYLSDIVLLKNSFIVGIILKSIQLLTVFKALDSKNTTLSIPLDEQSILDFSSEETKTLLSEFKKDSSIKRKKEELIKFREFVLNEFK